MSYTEDVIEECFRILRVTYNNLASEDDWKLLFVQLLIVYNFGPDVDLDWFDYILEHVFKNELQNATVVLLQSLSPIRFAFIDGQSRITSVHHYLRKVVPHIDGTLSSLQEASRLSKSDFEKTWTLSMTASPADCEIFTLPSTCGERFVSRRFLTEMRKISKRCMEKQMLARATFNSVVPNNLSDCVTEMIEERPKDDIIVGLTISDKLEKMFKHVLRTIGRFDKMLQRRLLGSKLYEVVKNKSGDEYATEIYNRIRTVGKRRTHPSLKSKSKKAGGELMVLMLVLGTALYDVKATRYLETCINTEWLVLLSRLTGLPSEELPEKFHEGTFFDKSLDDKVWFHSKLYLVSSSEKEWGNGLV